MEKKQFEEKKQFDVKKVKSIDYDEYEELGLDASELVEDLSEFLDTGFNDAWYFDLNILTIDIICSECRRSKDDKMYELLGLRVKQDTWRRKLKDCRDIIPHTKKYAEDFVEEVRRKLPFLNAENMTKNLLCQESDYFYTDLPKALKNYAILKANYNKFVDLYMKDIGKIKNLLSVLARYENKIKEVQGKLDIQENETEHAILAAKSYNEELREIYNELIVSNGDLLDENNLKRRLDSGIDALYKIIVAMIKIDYKSINTIKRTKTDYQKLLYYLKFEEHHINYNVKAYVRTAIGSINAKELWDTMIILENEGKVTEETYDNFINALDEQIAVAKARKAMWKLKQRE